MFFDFREDLHQIADVHIPQVVEQVFEAPKISSQDRNLQGTRGADSCCLRAGDGRAVGETSEDRIRGQNPGADRGADL